MINILLIGCGYHARRIYVPHLMEQKKAQLVAVVDLVSQKNKIDEFLVLNLISDIDFYYTDNYSVSDNLTTEEVLNLKLEVTTSKSSF
ncbi:MAG: hypothetical protein WCJ59_00460, partial [bacterium]